jgi:hypothetical protein
VTRSSLPGRAGRFHVHALTLVAVVLATAAVGSSARADPVDTTLRHYSLEEVSDILRDEGYGSVRIDEGYVEFKAEGRTYTLFRYADGDLQLYFGLAGPRVPLEQMNLWNRKYRLSRAYVDDEQDPVLEADLLANAGISPKIITEFVQVFIHSCDEFRQFVAKHDRSALESAEGDDG